MRRVSWVILLTIAAIAQCSAQSGLDFLGFSDYIADAVRNEFPASALRTQVVGQIPQAIGHGGTAIVNGVDNNGNLIGNGVSGATTASSNINISSGILSTEITWTTSVSWSASTFSDGYVYIKLTVTWGNSSENYTRTIDIKTQMTNQAASNGSGSVPIVFTGSNWSGFHGSNGYFELISYPAQYGYMGADGTYYVVGYTAYVWVWVPDGGGGGGQNEY